MPKPGRLVEIEHEHNEPLATLIPRKLNELGTIEAVARELGTTYGTIFGWCKENRVRKQFTWIKEESPFTPGEVREYAVPEAQP
jgi:hypothetical protein